jgi:multidrug efflux pump
MAFLLAFVNRPIMATAVNLVVLVLGLVAFQQLELRINPKVSDNEVRIITRYPGSNNLAVEEQVTKPLEDALAGMDGIKKLNSTSQDGQSQIQVKFKENINPSQAVSQVRDRVFAMLSALPKSVERPEIQEEAENSPTLLYLAFEDRVKTVTLLSDYIRRVVEDKLRLVDGVSSVDRFGDQLYQIEIQPDPTQLVLHGITITDVVHAIRREKSLAAGGEIETVAGKETVLVSAPFATPEAFAKITLKAEAMGRVTIGDVAKVLVTEKAPYFYMRVDGVPVVGLGVKAKPQANPLEVVKRVQHFVHELQKTMPPSMKASVIYDATKPFRSSYNSLKRTLLEAIVLVGIVVILSLASIRAALIPIITIPLCLIGSFILMWALGFSVNPVTLLALVLAVGLVVDDAIVVVENVYRHMERGLSALAAARQGMKEISFSIIVMTITLAAVYVPIAFQQDESVVMFREFAWTLAGSVLISGFVALTLTPALCGKFLKESHEGVFWQKMGEKYKAWLSVTLLHPKKVLGFLGLIALLGWWGFHRLPAELTPFEDEDHIQGYMTIVNTVPKAVRNGWFEAIEKITNTVSERERILTMTAQDAWYAWYLILKPRTERSRSVQAIATELQGKIKHIAGPMIGMQLKENTGGEESLKIVVQYMGENSQLLNIVKAIIDEARAIPGIERLDSEQIGEKPKLKLLLDRELAAELGVGMDSVEDTLYTFLTGRKAADYSFEGFNYDVIVRAEKRLRSDFFGLNEFFVAGGEGQWIPLGNIVTLKEVLEPNEIKHYDRVRGAAITVSLKPEMTLDKAMKILEPIVKKHLPKDAYYRFAGKAQKLQESGQAMWLTFGLALIIIYLVLAALFESFIDPFVVLLTVPLSVAGAIWAINAVSGTLNIYSAIGFITLVGLITKHGILIVDFSNQLRDTGMPKVEAVLKAAEGRLRPVIMTTLAMVFGAIPLVYSLGAGAAARQNIGWVIIGGMLAGTVFSLFVVPVVYNLVAKRNGV